MTLKGGCVDIQIYIQIQELVRILRCKNLRKRLECNNHKDEDGSFTRSDGY